MKKSQTTKFKDNYFDSAAIRIAEFVNQFATNSMDLFVILVDIVNNNFYNEDLDKLLERLKQNLKWDKFSEFHVMRQQPLPSKLIEAHYFRKVQAVFFEYYYALLLDQLTAFNFDISQRDKIIKETFYYWDKENRPYSKDYKFQGVFGDMKKYTSKGSVYRFVNKRKINTFYIKVETMEWVKGYINEILKYEPKQFDHIATYYIKTSLRLKDELAPTFVGDFQSNIKLYWGLLGQFEADEDTEDLEKEFEKK